MNNNTKAQGYGHVRRVRLYKTSCYLRKDIEHEWEYLLQESSTCVSLILSVPSKHESQLSMNTKRRSLPSSAQEENESLVRKSGDPVQQNMLEDRIQHLESIQMKR